MQRLDARLFQMEDETLQTLQRQPWLQAASWWPPRPQWRKGVTAGFGGLGLAVLKAALLARL